MRTTDSPRHAYQGEPPAATLARRSRVLLIAVAAACALALLLATVRGELPASPQNDPVVEADE